MGMYIRQHTKARCPLKQGAMMTAGYLNYSNNLAEVFVSFSLLKSDFEHSGRSQFSIENSSSKACRTNIDYSTTPEGIVQQAKS
jgi:hypothetical protein